MSSHTRNHPHSYPIPRYVTRKDVVNNVVYISNNYYQSDKKRDTFVCGQVNWSQGDVPTWWRQWLKEGGQGAPPGLKVKVRHGPNMNEVRDLQFGHEDQGNWCDVALPEAGASWEGVCVRVQLHSDDQGLAPGQFAVFYHGDVCLGSAIIM